ncbi:MAG: hypothetical protein IJP98_03385 [Clostridia bacterium]|nr:hypothetical protein [Clostridia bacterium]
MTELEILQRAKMYLDKLANGINPLTDQPASDSDCINQVRISRCLFYVSDVLRKVIENGGNIGKAEKIRKQPFTITHETLSSFRLSGVPISVSEITKRINELVDESAMDKLKYTSISAFLLQSGFLALSAAGDGEKTKTPTKQGNSIGITSEERAGQAGPYRVTVYNTEAQQFILDHMDAIIEINNRKSMRPAADAEYRGLPWTSTYDETLVDLFRKNVPVSEIAITLKRTESGVLARLKKLGLIEKYSYGK